MDSVIRGVAVYLFLMIIFRLSGKRTLYQATTFDFVLLLIIAETAQQALLGNDFSIVNSFVLIVTLIIMDIAMSILKEKFKSFDKAADGCPVILLDNGKLHRERMKRARVDEQDIMESARELQGLKNLDEIKYAILEKSGGITVIPKEKAR
jgi:uncharacterized membrane protein YcaP (DUF421 family)